MVIYGASNRLFLDCHNSFRENLEKQLKNTEETYGGVVILNKTNLNYSFIKIKKNSNSETYQLVLVFYRFEKIDKKH